MRSLVISLILLLGVRGGPPLPVTFVNGNDYPVDLQISPAPDTTSEHVSAGARARPWNRLPDTLVISRDSARADPLTFVFGLVPARAKAARFLLLCGTNLYFISADTPPLPIQKPERDCFKRAVFHLSPLD